MTWEKITSWVSQFTDKPIVITVVSILIVAALAFVYLSKSSIGVKAIKKLTKLYELGSQTAKDTLEKVKEVELLAKEEIKGLKAEYEQKVAILISIVNFYEETLFIILEDIPNAKVQAKLSQFKESYQEKKQEITATIGEIYQDFNLAVENKESEIRKEYEDKIAYLENRIKEIGLYVNELKGAYEDGEREEKADSNPTEEEIQSD